MARERDNFIAEHFMDWTRWDTFCDKDKTVPQVLFHVPGKQWPVEAPKWSTDSTLAQQLAYVELPKKGYRVEIVVAAANDPTVLKEERVQCLAVKYGQATKFFRATGETFSDAVTKVVCQVAQDQINQQTEK